ncbi:unnamed protein product [Rotaria socialis]|uniref:Uncharacterized protein n=1 Tax=Rotaria socialis TaxID=392032 RepID=A0A817ZSM9_9BILA|nr:unnamed protein product [Rotaria socialis]
MHYMQDNATVIAGGRGNQAYILAAAPIYDEWIRNNYELRVWQTYLQIGIQGRHWAKEIVSSKRIVKLFQLWKSEQSSYSAMLNISEPVPSIPEIGQI